MKFFIDMCFWEKFPVSSYIFELRQFDYRNINNTYWLAKCLVSFMLYKTRQLRSIVVMVTYSKDLAPNQIYPNSACRFRLCSFAYNKNSYVYDKNKKPKKFVIWIFHINFEVMWKKSQYESYRSFHWHITFFCRKRNFADNLR